MLGFLGPRHVDEVLLAEAVIPAAVPGHQQVGVLLEGSGKLSAAELLYVDIAVGVGVGFQFDLGVAPEMVQARTTTVASVKATIYSL